MGPASPAPTPPCHASVPKTRPMAQPLIAIGMHLLAPASAPERVKVTLPSVSPLAVAISRAGSWHSTGISGTAGRTARRDRPAGTTTCALHPPLSVHDD